MMGASNQPIVRLDSRYPVCSMGGACTVVVVVRGWGERETVSE
jgi:hypothetical protein